MGITEIITIAIALFGLIFLIKQINQNTKVSKADFIYRLRNDFYSKKSKFILFFIEEKIINNKNKDDKYFTLDRDKIINLHIEYSDFKNFAELSNYVIHIQDMDNYVLGYLNDIGEYLKKGVIDKDYVVNSFQDPFRVIRKNKIIWDYIHQSKKYQFIENIERLIKNN